MAESREAESGGGWRRRRRRRRERERDTHTHTKKMRECERVQKSKKEGDNETSKGNFEANQPPKRPISMCLPAVRCV